MARSCTKVTKNENFEVETENGSLVSQSLVVATRRTIDSHRSALPTLATVWLGSLVLAIQETRPALVPFTLSSQTLSELDTSEWDFG